MSILISCPLSGTDGHNGQKGNGYTAGGAAYHATRCAAMAEVIGVEAPVEVTRGPRSEAEAIEAARQKWAAKSTPQAAVPAGEVVVLANGQKAVLI